MRPDREIVIGLDSSTTATKAIAWRPDGSLAGEGRSPVPLSSPAPDRYEQDPEDWWRSACKALRELLQWVDPDAVAAIAISNQRETFAPLAEDGRCVRPAIVWLDQRCGEEVAWLTGRIGGERFHRRGHLYRSLLEGIALEQTLVTDMIEDATGASVREFVAVGGGAASDLWCQIMADATGRSIRRSATLEASSLGAAVCAAVGAGIYGSAIEAAAAMSGQALREINPSPDNRAVYADLLGIYREVYPSLRQTFAKLARRATTCASLPGSMSP